MHNYVSGSSSLVVVLLCSNGGIDLLDVDNLRYDSLGKQRRQYLKFKFPPILLQEAKTFLILNF